MRFTMADPRRSFTFARASALALLALVFTPACASLEFKRVTPTSGTFRSTGTAFTFFSIDLPREAMQIARENAVDAGQANLVILHSRVTPDLGWWNWLLDIISVRYAELEGTWGHAESGQAGG
jgi:hypothetical protein